MSLQWIHYKNTVHGETRPGVCSAKQHLQERPHSLKWNESVFVRRVWRSTGNVCSVARLVVTRGADGVWGAIWSCSHCTALVASCSPTAGRSSGFNPGSRAQASNQGCTNLSFSSVLSFTQIQIFIPHSLGAFICEVTWGSLWDRKLPTTTEWMQRTTRVT